MKILHACLAGEGVTDGWSYQDNLLTKYHQRMGHEVVIVAPQEQYNNDGVFVKTPARSYINENNCKIHRLRIRGGLKSSSRLKTYIGLSKLLDDEKPDIIFVHGCQCLETITLAKYAKKHTNLTLYVDNHADFGNSASTWLSKNILHRIVWKYCAQKIEPYTAKFYGVLPARVDFLADIYKLPRNKIELLVMGADDELVAAARQPKISQSIRNKYNIDENDFLIMTGGKIDTNKHQTLLLMEAVNSLDRKNAKLVIFGSVIPQMKKQFELLLCKSIQYIGWIDSQDTYKYINAADLVVFPGLHSVLWEQAVALGKPCLFRYMKGFTHIDLGGNCGFLYEDSVEEIRTKIQTLIDNRTEYAEMKRVALERGMDVFSYRSIAERSIMEV